MKNKKQVTRLQELETRLAEKEKIIRANKKDNALRDRLQEILSHDVQSPLRFMTMVGKAVLTKEKELSKEEIRDALADINQTGTRMLLLISNMLKWVEYQKENKKMPASVENLHQLINDKMEFFRFMANSKQTQLVNKVPKGILIKTDKAAFGVVIQNLLNNAVKFTSDGTITVRAVLKGNKILVTVKDTGKGMTEEQLIAIKKRKKIIPNPDTDNFKGSGIGWELIRELLKHLHAGYEISSKKARGTSVTLLLPAGYT